MTTESIKTYKEELLKNNVVSYGKACDIAEEMKEMVCEFCEGTGVAYQANGQDDYDLVKCACVEETDESDQDHDN